MIKLKSHPFGRDVWIDPDRVSAIFDAVEMRPSTVHGGEPTAAIVGTMAIVDGAQVVLAGPVGDNAREIMKAQTPRFPILN